LQSEIFQLPAYFYLKAQTAGNTGGSGGGYGGIEGGGTVAWSPISLLSTSISATISSISGDAGQKRLIFLPGFSASFAINETHRFVGAFSPRVRMNAILRMIDASPFLDASANVRHTIVSNKGSLGIESVWDPSVRSTIELETSRSSDYPVIADTGSIGLFRVFYGEVTETLIRASVVAKLPANHYFSAIAIIRSSKYSTSGLSVPYLPMSEVRLSYRSRLSERLDVESRLQIVSSRETKSAGPALSLPGHVRMDIKSSYTILPGLKAWAAVQNVFGGHIEYWTGYQESPFLLNIGVSYAL
jgi:hypothetical protein